MLLDLRPGDEFIVPSFTFVSTANAMLLRGAKPVFVDCSADGNIDLDQVEQLINKRTRAIVPVHYAGNSCDMDRLRAIAGTVPIVEDAAQAITSTWKGRPLGSFGALGAMSFHETKNVGAGEGGALIVNDPSLVERAEYLRDKGTNRKRFLNGVVDKYTWVDLGSSYVLSDLNAAYLWTQLSALDRIQQRRAALFNRYHQVLASVALQQGIQVISPAEGNNGNAHLFALVMRSGEQRAKFISFMRERSILTPFHYVSLHQSPMGVGYHDGRQLPMTERLSSCLVRLPLYFNLTDAEQERVTDAVLEFMHDKA